MNLKLDATIALRYSLYYAIFLLIHEATLVALYQPQEEDFYALRSVLITPLLLIVFPLMAVLAHRHYRKKTSEARFSDVLLISGLFMFLTYTFEFGISWTFFKVFLESTVVINEDKGIFAIFNDFASSQPHAPVYRPFAHLMTVPLPEFQIISEYFSTPVHLLGYVLGYVLTFLCDPLVATLFTLYLESVYLLFRKYNQKPWLAIVPFANLWVLVRITGRPAWWNIFLYIPVVRWFFLYAVNRGIAGDFGRTNLHALGMTLLPSVFYGPVAFHAIQPRRDNTVAPVDFTPTM